MAKNYSVINGKLYEDGNPIELEVGNKEQINFLKYYQGGIQITADIETVHILSADFKCTCGKNVYYEQEVKKDNDYSELDGTEIRCNNCNNVYRIEADEEGNEEDFIVKFKNIKR